MVTLPLHSGHFELQGEKGVRMARRLKVVFAILGVVLSTSVLGVSPAGAAPTLEESPRWTSVPNTPFVSISPVDDVAAVVGDVGRTAFAKDFFGLALTPDRSAIDLYMNEPLSAPDLIGRAKLLLGSAAREVPINVHKAPYERPVLHAARAAIWDLASTTHSQGVFIHAISVRADGTGLTVFTNAPDKASAIVGTARLGEVSAGDLKFDLQVEPVTPTSRFNDYPPYAGGVKITFPAPVPGGVGGCTTGFGLRLTNGATGQVTASHCALGDVTVRDGGGDIMGNVSPVRFTYRDAEVIVTPAWQGVYTDGEQYFTYRNYAFSYQNQLVCQSGYTSDKICSLAVVDDDIEYQLGNIYGSPYAVRGVRAVPLYCDTCVAVRNQDSGGPVWVPAGGGRQSRGIVSAASGQLPGTYNGQNQYNTLYFTETGWILPYYSASLLVD